MPKIIDTTTDIDNIIERLFSLIQLLFTVKQVLNGQMDLT